MSKWNPEPKWPDGVGCPCMLEECVCPPAERALRAWMGGFSAPMTIAQREWCLREIDSVEGYRREDYQNLPKADLAGEVLHAWTDYCRDKGLL